MKGMTMKEIFEDMENAVSTFFNAIDKMKEDDNESN
jgi:hypothetical protein